MHNAAGPQRERFAEAVRLPVVAAFLMARARLLAASILVVLLIATGCGPGKPFKVDLHQEVTRPTPRVVLFICDGCKADLLRQGCAEGWLPNINEHFVLGGTQVDHAVTCHPSITYAILTSFATGVTPATHGVLANEWFDRGLRLNRAYGTIRNYRDVNGDFCVPTLYERMRPKVSISIQDAIHRGVTRNIANWAQSGVRWFFKDYTAVDKLSATTLNEVVEWANKNERWPDLLVCYFPGADSVGHVAGPESQRYRESIEHVDYQLGRVCDWLREKNMLEDTYLVFVSDHGHVQVTKDGYVDLPRYLRQELGRRVHTKPVQGTSYLKRKPQFEHADTVLVRSAVRYAMLYFRGEYGWDSLLTHGEVRELLETSPAGQRIWDLPGVDVAAYQISENEVELRSAAGTARVREVTTPAGVAYQYAPSPDDVLGYLNDMTLAAFVQQGPHTADEWLSATADAVYPNFVPDIVPLLRHPRCGDVVLFAAHGYSFGHERGGHGGLHRDEMQIPMLFAGPGIPAGGHLPVAHATDVAPTLLDLLECPASAREGMQGRSLLAELRTEKAVAR